MSTRKIAVWIAFCCVAFITCELLAKRLFLTSDNWNMIGAIAAFILIVVVAVIMELPKRSGKGDKGDASPGNTVISMVLGVIFATWYPSCQTTYARTATIEVVKPVATIASKPIQLLSTQTNDGVLQSVDPRDTPLTVSLVGATTDEDGHLFLANGQCLTLRIVDTNNICMVTADGKAYAVDPHLVAVACRVGWILVRVVIGGVVVYIGYRIVKCLNNSPGLSNRNWVLTNEANNSFSASKTYSLCPQDLNLLCPTSTWYMDLTNMEDQVGVDDVKALELKDNQGNVFCTRVRITVFSRNLAAVSDAGERRKAEVMTSTDMRKWMSPVVTNYSETWISENILGDFVNGHTVGYDGQGKPIWTNVFAFIKVGKDEIGQDVFTNRSISETASSIPRTEPKRFWKLQLTP